MSCSTRTAPWAPPEATGAARAMMLRESSRGGDSCSASGTRPDSAAAISDIAG